MAQQPGMEDQEPNSCSECLPVPNSQENAWVPYPGLAELVPWTDIYRIGDKITDATADGRVYKAEKKQTRDAGVLKFMYKNKDSEKLYRELHVLNNVKHPNVVGLLGVYSVPDFKQYEFVMAFAEADTDLRCMLARREGHRIGVLLVKIVAMQIAQGLEALHRKHVLHRDLKPANILIYYACRHR